MTIAGYWLTFSTLVICGVFNGIQEGLRQIIGPFLMIMILPNNIGLAVSLSTLGSAFSTTYWSVAGLELINPYDHMPTIKILEGKRSSLYFDEKIADRTPEFFILGAYPFY